MGCGRVGDGGRNGGGSITGVGGRVLVRNFGGTCIGLGVTVVLGRVLVLFSLLLSILLSLLLVLLLSLLLGLLLLVC